MITLYITLVCSFAGTVTTGTLIDINMGQDSALVHIVGPSSYKGEFVEEGYYFGTINDCVYK